MSKLDFKEISAQFRKLCKDHNLELVTARQPRPLRRYVPSPRIKGLCDDIVVVDYLDLVRADKCLK